MCRLPKHICILSVAGGILITCAATTAAAEDIEPVAWRVGLAIGFGGAVTASEVALQLREARYEEGFDVGDQAYAEVWLTRFVTAGGGFDLHRIFYSGPGDDDSTLDTMTLFASLGCALRKGPGMAGPELGVHLVAGPALVTWWLNGVAERKLGLHLRLVGRLGGIDRSGVVLSMRPWLGVTLGARMGAGDLSATALLAGFEVSVAWEVLGR